MASASALVLSASLKKRFITSGSMSPNTSRSLSDSMISRLSSVSRAVDVGNFAFSTLSRSPSASSLKSCRT